jgi:hypothetical protein
MGLLKSLLETTISVKSEIENLNHCRPGRREGDTMSIYSHYPRNDSFDDGYKDAQHGRRDFDRYDHYDGEDKREYSRGFDARERDARQEREERQEEQQREEQEERKHHQERMAEEAIRRDWEERQYREPPTPDFEPVVEAAAPVGGKEGVK